MRPYAPCGRNIPNAKHVHTPDRNTFGWCVLPRGHRGSHVMRTKAGPVEWHFILDCQCGKARCDCIESHHITPEAARERVHNAKVSEFYGCRATATERGILGGESNRLCKCLLGRGHSGPHLHYHELVYVTWTIQKRRVRPEPVTFGEAFLRLLAGST